MSAPYVLGPVVFRGTMAKFVEWAAVHPGVFDTAVGHDDDCSIWDQSGKPRGMPYCTCVPEVIARPVVGPERN